MSKVGWAWWMRSVCVCMWLPLSADSFSFSLFLFGLGYSIYWFNLGAWLSIMPNYIKKKFGKDLYAALYGKVFLGYGISALLGTLFSSVILDFFGNTLYLYIFILLLAFILFLFVRKESI